MRAIIDFGLFRRPFFILATFLLFVLPDVVEMCTEQCSVEGPLDELADFGSAFFLHSFFNSSVVSLIQVLIVFECIKLFSRLFQMRYLPARRVEALKTLMMSAMSGASAFLLFVLLNIILYWITQQQATVITDINYGTGLIRTVLISMTAYQVVLFYNQWKYRRDPLRTTIKVAGDMHVSELELRKIKWFEKEGRSYYALTSDGKYRLDYNLQQLEEKLSGKYFVRINRSVIANLHIVDEYRYWEHEKYIIRMQCGREFVATRKRVVALKQQLALA